MVCGSGEGLLPSPRRYGLAGIFLICGLRKWGGGVAISSSFGVGRRLSDLWSAVEERGCSHLLVIRG